MSEGLKRLVKWRGGITVMGDTEAAKYEADGKRVDDGEWGTHPRHHEAVEGVSVGKRAPDPTCRRDLPSEPITAEWLAANGKPCRLGQSSTWWEVPIDQWTGLVVSTQTRVGEFSAVTNQPGQFTVSLHGESYDTDVFLRRVSETWELVRLWEGLTGRAWEGRTT